jgi:hypothetical protein
MVEPRKKILCIEDDRETAALIVEELADGPGSRTASRQRQSRGAHDGCCDNTINAKRHVADSAARKKTKNCLAGISLQSARPDRPQNRDSPMCLSEPPRWPLTKCLICYA